MRRLGLLILALALVVVAGYSAYWFVMADRLRQGVAPWAAARQAEGYRFAWDRLELDGFPFAFRIHVAGARVDATKPLPYSASASALAVEAKPWDLQNWRFTAPQGAHLTMGDAAALDAASGDGMVAVASTTTAVTLDLHDAAGKDALAGLGANDVAIQAILPAKPPAAHGDTALSLAVQLAKLRLPAGIPPLGAEIDALAFEGRVKGVLLPGPPKLALAQWRDEGGTVELETLALRWGALDAVATGTMALDRELQPVGALTATIAGQNQIVDAAVAGGMLRARDAGIAKAVLGALAKPGRDGRPEITVPVSVQDQKVFLGPAQIAALPRLDWQ